MSKRLLKLAAVTAVAVAGSAFTYGALGGWAVVTVEDLPEYATAGKPVDITFRVRQHGIGLLPNLEPTLLAKDGKSNVRVSATPAAGDGRYSATLVVPRAGEWSITINSGFMDNKITLASLPVVAAGAAAPRPQAPAARGQRLFIAKGCATCHVHAEIAGSGPVKAGPDLTPKRYQADYLAKFLGDPSIARTPGNMNVMPKLELKPSEVVALTAFLNAEKAVSSR